MKLKKLLSRIIIATGIMFTGTLTYQTIEHTHVSHAASYNYYSKHQCTWWAYKRRVQLGHKPKKYAVMQSTAGYYGHVAIVEKVYNSGSIKISEYNYNVPLGYGTRIISKSSARHYNYIY